MSPANKPKTPTWINLLALLTIVVMLGAIAGLQIFSARATSILGPTVIASDQRGDVVVVSHGTLFYVPRVGKVEQLDLTKLGVSDTLSDIRHVDGGWWLADPDASAIINCDLPKGDCVTIVGGGDQRLARRSFKFAVNESRIFVTDTARHRLLVFKRDGTPTTNTRGNSPELCFPNQLEFIDDSLYIADTNNHRIAVVQPDIDVNAIKTQRVFGQARQDNLLRKLFQRRSIHGWCEDFGSELPGEGNAELDRLVDYRPTQRPVALDGATPGRVWPTSFARTADGDWWVVVGDNNLSYGDLLTVSANANIKRLELPQGADPVSVRIVEDKVLVTDAALFRVHQFSLDGRAQGDFASARLSPLLQSAAMTKRDGLAYRHLATITIYVCAGLVLLILVLLWRVRSKAR